MIIVSATVNQANLEGLSFGLAFYGVNTINHGH